LGSRSATNKMVSAMTSKINAALVASVSAIALMLATNAAFAGPAAAGGHAAGSVRAGAPAHIARHSLAPFRPHRRNFGNFGNFWPAFGAYDYPPLAGDSNAAMGMGLLPQSNDVRYTYQNDVPWDWAHRFPPNVAPSDKPYVSTCPSESVTVPGRNGQDTTVNIIRCY